MSKLFSLLFIISLTLNATATEINDGHRTISDGDILRYMNSTIVAFDKYNSIESCIYLTQRFAGLRNDPFDKDVLNYELARKYGEKCIALGVNKTPAGWAVNIWLAYVYNKQTAYKPARDFLNTAQKLDVHKKIQKLRLIHRYKLQQLLK